MIIPLQGWGVEAALLQKPTLFNCSRWLDFTERSECALIFYTVKAKGDPWNL